MNIKIIFLIFICIINLIGCPDTSNIKNKTINSKDSLLYTPIYQLDKNRYNYGYDEKDPRGYKPRYGDPDYIDLNH